MSTEQNTTPTVTVPTKAHFHLLTPNIKSPELHALNVKWIRHQGDIAMVELDLEADAKLIGKLRDLIKGGMLKLSEIPEALYLDKKKLRPHVSQDQRLKLRLFAPEMQAVKKEQTERPAPPVRADQAAVVGIAASVAKGAAGSRSSSIPFKNVPLNKVDMTGDWPPMTQ